MKKLGTLLLMIICLLTTGCSSNKTKEVATLDQFSTSAMNNNFTIVTDLYEDVDYILDSAKASYDDIEIEMVQYIDSDHATKAQDSHIENFDLRRSTGAHETKEKGKNYYSYELISNGRYMFSIRVDETLLFGSTLLEDKETVQKIINELGY